MEILDVFFFLFSFFPFRLMLSSWKTLMYFIYKPHSENHLCSGSFTRDHFFQEKKKKDVQTIPYRWKEELFENSLES